MNVSGIGIDDPGRHVLRGLCLRLGAQLHQLLRPRDAGEVRRAVARPSTRRQRKKLVWEIDRKLQQDGARPVIYHNRAATCWQPHVKGVTMAENSHLQPLAVRGRLARQVGGRKQTARRDELRGQGAGRGEARESGLYPFRLTFLYDVVGKAKSNDERLTPAGRHGSSTSTPEDPTIGTASHLTWMRDKDGRGRPSRLRRTAASSSREFG